MILHTLSHVGSYAFPDREIAVDFERLPALVGVTGPNGSGKTTCLDLIVGALYLEFPYRPTALWRQFVRPGHIELVWEIENGTIYRSRVKVDPELEKTEASLSVLLEDRIARSQCDGSETTLAGPLVKDYRRAVEAILGPLDLLLASAYAVQNGAGAFLRAVRADRKTVLAELLGLQRFPRLEAGAKGKASVVDIQLTTLRTQLAAHQERAAAKDALVAQRETVRLRHDQAEQRRDAAHVTLEAAREQAAQTRAARAALDPVQAERPRVAQELAGLVERLEAHERRLANNREVVGQADRIRAAVTRHAEIATAHTRLEALAPERAPLRVQLAELETRLDRIRREIAANENLVTRAEEIRAAVKRDGELVARLETLELELEEARQSVRVTTEERNRLVLTRQHTEEQVRTYTRDVERYQRQASLRSDVPCEGQGIYAGCQFLQDATLAATLEPQATDALVLAQAALEQLIVPDPPTDGSLVLQERKVALQGERRALGAVVTLVGSLDASQARLETYASQLADAESDRRAKAARLAALDDDLAQAPGLEAEQRELADTVALRPVLEAAASRIEELTIAIAALQADHGLKIARLAEIDAQLAALPGLDDRARQAQQTVNAAEDQRRLAQQDITVLERDLGGLDAQVRVALEAEQTAARLAGALTPVHEDLADWTLLARAFGASGIPALLIDQACPEIGTVATELLRECYGESVFTIELRTQRDSADGDRKLETLDVIVSRGAEPIEASLLSGGEAVLVSESLSLALALYTASRAGRAIRTLLRDEVSAPLDVDRAPSYARMLRRAAQLGGFRHVLFVSHQPACLELADAQLEIRAGAIRVA